MILRLAGNAAIHTAAGVAMGVTVALAACTVAQAVQRGKRSTERTVTPRTPTPPPAGMSDPSPAA